AWNAGNWLAALAALGSAEACTVWTTSNVADTPELSRNSKRRTARSQCAESVAGTSLGLARSIRAKSRSDVASTVICVVGQVVACAPCGEAAERERKQSAKRVIEPFRVRVALKLGVLASASDRVVYGPVHRSNPSAVRNPVPVAGVSARS